MGADAPPPSSKGIGDRVSNLGCILHSMGYYNQVNTVFHKFCKYEVSRCELNSNYWTLTNM